MSCEVFWITLRCTDTASSPGSMSLQSKIDWGGQGKEAYSFAVNYLLPRERDADDIWFIIIDMQRKMLQDDIFLFCVLPTVSWCLCSVRPGTV